MTTFGGEQSTTSTGNESLSLSSSSAQGIGIVQFGSNDANTGGNSSNTGNSTNDSMTNFGRTNLTTGSSSISVIDTSTPFLATADGNIQLLQESLIQLNIVNNNIQSCIDTNGYTLLHAAASYNHLHICQWIIQQCQYSSSSSSSTNSTQNTNTSSSTLKSYINAVDNDGDSALHYCSTKTIAQYLIEVLHININIINKHGQTAIQCKLDEYNEYITDEEYDENDIHSDCIVLKELILYLQSLSTIAQ